MKKLYKFIKVLFSIFLASTYAYLIYLLSDFGFFANKLLLVFCAIILFIIILILIGIFKLKQNILKILLFIVGIIGILINVIGIYYLNSTLDFLENFSNKKQEYDYYYVISLKKNVYKDLSDLKSKKIGMVEGLDSEVLNEIKISYEKKIYEKVESLLESLYDNNTDAIIVSDIEEYILEENDEDFSRKVKVIHTIKIKKETEVKASIKDTSNESFSLYISGIDTAGVISKVSRSDVNIIATINPKTNQVLLTTIPRDYYVQLHGTKGLKDKLTHAGIYGINMSINTIEDLLDMDIDYYARVNFDTVVHLVNELGGINVYSDKNLSFCNIKEGYNYLMGDCALRFARERKSYETGDRHRGENQEEVIKAIINKVETSGSLLTKYNSILKNLEGDFQTNVTLEEIKKLVKLQVSNMPKWSIKTYNLNGRDSHNYTYSGGNRVLYVMEPDEASVNKTKEIIKSVLEGKTYEEIGI
ncbi:MAG: LCP family protein [Candidatus Aphodocola sp.]